MRKVNIILLIVLICLITGSTYFIFFHDDKQKVDYTYYYETYEKLKNNETYEPFDDITIIANKKVIAMDTYSIFISITDAKYNMNNLDILIIDKDEKTAPLDVFYPSLGLIEDDSINLTNSTDTNDTTYEIINLNFHTPNNVENILVYFEFSNDSNERITKYIEAPVTYVEA